MRITGWRVDGFGVLADHRVDEIPPGLTIVHGPNEAGKSTLLDFVRDVLFGFPGGSTPKRAPRRGGRYGGTLFLADDDGLAWTVERHDRADAVVTGPGGVVAADSALPRLLGGVDRKVFESIFAFGLDELAAIRALDAEEVRDLVFSAGVLGAGRSATRAREALKKRREVLVRPRQPSAVTNRLRGELDELDRQLAGLRAGALSYPAVAERCRQLRDRARAARDGSERARHRSHELAVLEACWPDRAALVLAERERAADPGPSPRDLALRELAGEIERLGRDRSGQDERLAQRRELDSRAAELERAVSERAARLGPHVDRSRALAARVDATTRSRVSELATGEAAARARAEAATRTWHEAAATLAQARGMLDEATPDGHPGVPTEELERRVRDLGELEELVRERDVLRSERLGAAQAARIAALEARRRAPVPTAIAVALLLAALLAGAATALLPGLGAAATAVLAALAAILLLLAGAAVASARGAPRDGTVSAAGSPEPDGAVDHDRLARRVAALAAASGLPPAPSGAEVRAASQHAADDLGRRRSVDRFTRDLARATARADDARYELGSAETAVASAEEALVRVASGLGLERAGAGAAALLELVDALDAIARLRSDRVEVAAMLERADQAAARYEADVARLAAALDVHGPPELAPTHGGHIALVAALGDELRASLDRAHERDARRRRADEARSALVRRLEAVPRSRELAEELASGDPGAWRVEQESLSRALETAEARHDELVKEVRDAERELEQLAQSSEIAEREIERERVAADLASALEHYCVAWLADHLLDTALRRYERERQPEVVARASSLFRAVTGGRYVDLVTRADAESSTRPELVALDAAGTALDAGSLSRGTAEQLYLCLRLALASSFARTAATLPIVLDDVLVNFDPARAAAVARAVVEAAETQQVVAFTCHPHLVEVLRRAACGARVVDLPASR